MQIEFERLTGVAIPELVALFNDPEVRRHLPLTRSTFTPEMCERFVAAKERLWAEHGYGPWAFFVDGAFAGWGGLQPEGDDADFGLVLLPRYWGIGRKLYREVLRHAFQVMGLESVIVLLPPSRMRVRALSRLGFRPDGEGEVGGERYRLLNPEHDPRPGD